MEGVSGDARSFVDLVAASAPGLLRLAVMLTGDGADAEDLLQTTLLRAVRHGDRIVAMSAPSGYLRRTMVNEHISGHRRWRRRATSGPWPGIPAPAGASDDVEAVDRRDETWRLLTTLTPRQRAVLVLRYYEDLPDVQIAVLLGCAEATVRSLARRGLAALRDHLDTSTEVMKT